MKVTPAQPCPHCHSRRAPIEPLFLSRKDAAAVLGVSLRAVAYLISQGELKYRKLGGRTMITVEELRRFARIPHRNVIVPAKA